MAFRSFEVLRNRDYALLWTSGLVSDTGTWMQTVAVAALVTELTESARWGALIGGIAYLGAGLMTPLGGVLADRHDRRAIMIITAVIHAVLAAILAVAYSAGLASPTVVVAITALEGAVHALMSPARSAMLPDLVRREQLIHAAALGSASWNVGRILGPALGGLVIAYGSYSAVFAINAVSFTVVIGAVALLKLPPLAAGEAKSVVARVREGFVGARREPTCWAAIRSIGVVAIFISPFIALIPAMAQLVFDGDAVDTAHFVAAQGVGAVTGALLLSILAERFGRQRVMAAAFVILPVASMAFALAPSRSLAIAGLVVLGAVYISVLSGLSTLVQLHAPVYLRARVIAAFSTTLNLAYPLGCVVQGAAADLIGIRQTLTAGAVIFAVILLTVALVAPTFRRFAEGSAPS